MHSADPEKRHRRYAVAATAAVAVVIAVATLAPVGRVPDAPGSDKLHHLLAFAALTMPATVLRPGLLRWILPAAIAYGGLIELIQPAVGRHRELADFLADSSGAVLGIGLGTLLRTIASARRDVPRPSPRT